MFILTDVRIDEQDGSTRHVRELFENLQQFADAYLVAPYATEKADSERILAVRGDLVPIPGLQTLLFRTLFLLHIVYHTVRRSPDVFYVRHSTQMIPVLLVGKAFGLPLVVELNGLRAEEHDLTGERPWLTRAILASERISVGLAGRFVTVTPQIGEYLRRKYDVPDDCVTCVPNGANVDLFRPLDAEQCKAELGLESDTSYVCFVGNLAPWQGVQDLLRSAPSVLSRFSDAKLLVVGDGIQRDQLESLTAELGLDDDVVFTGSVPYETVPRYVNASDVCVVYKRPVESGYSPLKLYEYMACGRPVIASDTDGFEILAESDAGLLVPPEDSDALATAISELLGDDAARETMGENGRDYVVANRSWEATAETVAAVLEDEAGDS